MKVQLELLSWELLPLSKNVFDCMRLLAKELVKKTY